MRDKSAQDQVAHLMVFQRLHLDAVGRWGRWRQCGEVGVGDEARLEVAVASRRVIVAWNKHDAFLKPEVTEMTQDFVERASLLDNLEKLPMQELIWMTRC